MGKLGKEKNFLTTPVADLGRGNTIVRFSKRAKIFQKIAKNVEKLAKN
jgi:hypothetical protein